MIPLRLAAFLGFSFGIHAFSDTNPLLAWSSTKSPQVDAIASRGQMLIQSENALDSVLKGDICNYDAVIVVEQPGLHAADLRSLPSSSYLVKALDSAPSSFHIPYLQPSNPVGLARTIARQCGSQSLDLDLNKDVSEMALSGKHAVSIDLPELDTVGRQRREQMQELDHKLSAQLSALTDAFPSYLVIVAGTTPSSFSPVKRQLADPQRSLPSAFSTPPVAASKPKKNKLKSGIFHRYQLLTPGLITSLGITFLLLLPLIFLVVSALAGIKSPVRSEGIKQAQEKKNQ